MVDNILGEQSSTRLPPILSREDVTADEQPGGSRVPKLKAPTLDFESSGSDDGETRQRADERKLSHFVSINNGLKKATRSPKHRIEDSQLKMNMGNASLDPTGLEGLVTDRKYQPRADNNSSSDDQEWPDKVGEIGQKASNANTSQLALLASGTSNRRASQASLDTDPAQGSDEEEEDKVKYDFLKLARAENSSALLKDMSFNVDISKLYSVCTSACNNQANRYCPVQLKVNDIALIEHYGGQYLIQLWTEK